MIVFLHHCRNYILLAGLVTCSLSTIGRVSAQQPRLTRIPDISLGRFGIVEPLADPYLPRQDLFELQESPPVAGAVRLEDLRWAQRMDPNDEGVLLASYPSELDRPWLDDSLSAISPPQQGKPGVFQKLGLTASWLDRGDLNGFGEFQWETFITFGFPMPTRERPLLITPGFQMRLWDGPATPELPAQVYDATLEFRWLGKFNPCWGYDVGVAPGVHSDFDRFEDDAIRITGRAVASFQPRPDITYVLGVVYLDREDVNLLPVAGLIWTPHDQVRWELVFPRPRVMWRWSCEGWTEDWLYLAGEFGGGSWSVQRSGVSDQVTVRDYRVLLGLERKSPSGAGRRIELGYVFGRVVEFASATPDYEPDDALLLRASWTY